MFSIDGLEWDVPCKIERTAKVTASEISGMMLDKSYFNDVLGTFMRYEISMAVPFGREGDYDEIYEALTAPVDGHTFVLPYNQETVTIAGRVESVRDVPYFLKNKNYWAETQFTVIANNPSKYMTLDQMITRGRSPFPESATAEIGSVYTYTVNGWVKTTYKDADNEEY